MIPRIHHAFAIWAVAAGLLGHAHAIEQINVKLFEEQTAPSRVSYSLDNPTGAQVIFDITLFAVSLPDDPNPVDPLAPHGWSAQVLSAADWSQPIGYNIDGVTTRPSWERFTGQAFTSVFSAGDLVLGYYIPFNPAVNGTWSYIPQEPIKPGQSLAGFSRAGLVASEFLAAGPSDSATFVGDAADNPTQGVGGMTGTATVVPEPSSAFLLLSGAAFLLRRRTLRTT